MKGDPFLSFDAIHGNTNESVEKGRSSIGNETNFDQSIPLNDTNRDNTDGSLTSINGNESDFF